MRRLLTAFVACATLAIPAEAEESIRCTGANPYRVNMLHLLSKNLSLKNKCNFVVAVVIGKDGSVLDHKLVESSGDGNCVKEALAAIGKTQFEPLPAFYKGKELKVRFEMHSSTENSASYASVLSTKPNGKAKSSHRKILFVDDCGQSRSGEAAVQQLSQQAFMEALNKGVELVNKQMYDEALVEFSKARKINGSSIALLNWITATYQQMNKFQEAAQVTEDIKRLDPDCAEAQKNVSFSHQMTREYEKTIEVYRQELELPEPMLKRSSPRE